ncbi:YraN family protein [Anaerobranca gottschalkii]|uniref:UPF0102 protein SAMN03080614_10395 n=1 Tax=Anaerobranca gottschalkii DSM 13577 TaxID=1120990 RepID=A0A1I0BFG9_9FIRM|nr:YraN family protein [Anaerobranca gottschalkii]SET05634.1 putative endonuclease [Anaerobranca gottschalkii DSM 13577]
MNKQQLAKNGEDIAAQYLQSQGLILIRKNFRCKLGEIDLILQDKETIVFCEVKTRTNLKFGDPLEAIDKKKLNKLVKLAQYYLITEKNNNPFRIDCVGIYIQGEDYFINWIKNCTL